MDQNPYQPSHIGVSEQRNWSPVFGFFFTLLWIKIAVVFTLVRLAMTTYYSEHDVVLPTLTNLLLHRFSIVFVLVCGVLATLLFRRAVQTQKRSLIHTTLWCMTVLFFVALIVFLMLPMASTNYVLV